MPNEAEDMVGFRVETVTILSDDDMSKTDFR
jgi:hypothetical protein